MQARLAGAWTESAWRLCAVLIGACALAQGAVLKRGMEAFEVKQCPTEMAAREYLRSLGLEHYWDIVLSNAILAED